ncbi:hypothetical protein [uncultured Bacteroides sp.]|uniref:hypothetical protein n=1 Tax=uncultured Bacteroides sp. TaxID=162156 RepID=UPI0025DDA03E|nr:hypothetical protein [uncultured Bacteroides sp.]
MTGISLNFNVLTGVMFRENEKVVRIPNEWLSAGVEVNVVAATASFSTEITVVSRNPRTSSLWVDRLAPISKNASDSMHKRYFIITLYKRNN